MGGSPYNYTFCVCICQKNEDFAGQSLFIPGWLYFCKCGSKNDCKNILNVSINYQVVYEPCEFAEPEE